MLYVADKSADDEMFGATKLNKILYFSDFLYYQKTGESITGANYMKLEFGPVPRRLLPIKNGLIARGDAIDFEGQYRGKTQKRLLAKRAPDLSRFTAEQIAWVDEVINALRSRNATNVSNMSHDLRWDMCGMEQQIPYQASYIASRSPTAQDVAWAVTIAA